VRRIDTLTTGRTISSMAEGYRPRHDEFGDYNFEVIWTCKFGCVGSATTGPGGNG
jgi:hypothetical protein